MRKSPNLVQPIRKTASKAMCSQDARRNRAGPKQEVSHSPIYKDTHINKENVHPNLGMQASGSRGKFSKSTKPMNSNLLHLGQRVDNNREIYFNLREDLKDKILKNGGSLEGSSDKKNCDYFSGHRNQSGPLNPQQTFASTLAHSSHLFNENQQHNKLSPVPTKEITIKINNRSLEKCQLYHQRQTPKAVYLVQQTIANRPTTAGTQQHIDKSQRNIDFICCEECGGNYSHKIPLKGLSESVLTEDGLKLKSYFRHLDQKKDTLKICQINLGKCLDKFRQMSDRQWKKQNMYYNKILETIEVAMKNSEDALMKQRNSGEDILSRKQSEIANYLRRIEEEMMILTNLEQRSQKFTKPRFSSSQLIHEIENNLSRLQLPIFQIFADWETQIAKFADSFQKNFAVRVLTYSDMAEQKKQASIPLVEQIVPVREVEDQQKPRFTKQIDLFCDQEMEDSRDSRGYNFSFEKASRVCPEDCIIELTEQEDVISPVFKAI